jgi:mono/diheme cytochrome c family protein
MCNADRRARAAWPLLALLCAAGCETNMYDQPRYDALDMSPFFGDAASARSRVAHTVARGELRADEALYYGTKDGRAVTAFPMPVTRELLARGAQRYAIYCVPCHGALGDGSGVVPQRGFERPPSYHVDRLRNAPVGYLFNVVSVGFGAMFGYAEDLRVEDRWAVIAYVRALQLSQHVEVASLPADARRKLEESGP